MEECIPGCLNVVWQCQQGWGGQNKPERGGKVAGTSKKGGWVKQRRGAEEQGSWGWRNVPGCLNGVWRCQMGMGWAKEIRGGGKVVGTSNECGWVKQIRGGRGGGMHARLLDVAWRHQTGMGWAKQIREGGRSIKRRLADETKERGSRQNE